MPIKFANHVFLSVLSIFLATQLSGCAGLAAGWRYRTDVPPQNITEQDKNSYKSKAGLLSSLGVPSDIECQADKKEIWTYYGEQRVGGLGLLVVVIPLPLMAPIGRDYKNFTLDDGLVVSQKHRETYMCNYGVVGALDFIFGTGLHKETASSCRFLGEKFYVSSRMKNLTETTAGNYCDQKISE